MSIQEARRPLFEAWIYERNDKEQSMEWISECRGPLGDYDASWLRLDWIAWNAALDSVCVLLPPVPEVPEEPEEAIDDSYMDAYHSAVRMRNDCTGRIKAAGVKCK